MREFELVKQASNAESNGFDISYTFDSKGNEDCDYFNVQISPRTGDVSWSVDDLKDVGVQFKLDAHFGTYSTY